MNKNIFFKLKSIYLFISSIDCLFVTIFEKICIFLNSFKVNPTLVLYVFGYIKQIYNNNNNNNNDNNLSVCLSIYPPEEICKKNCVNK